ncbi:hypothetical protein HGRIS_004185 [Hohenbuehelia grisea]|uniref:Integrase core domain-containing protein n=1 Tax=Hohenbuehelia grisea TaxID=104357 RepID=A0ABR3JIC7_9AGAR
MAQVDLHHSDVFAPSIDSHVYPACVLMKSVHNTVIEGFWRWLREKSGSSMKAHILRSKDEHVYDPNVIFHRDLFYWIFPPLVQAELDQFCTWWNLHRVRPQQDKDMPSGHVPLDALKYPSLYGGLNCLVEVPKPIIQDLREYLTEEVGSRKECLHWVTDEFEALANEVWEDMGSPRITFENSWTIFAEMADRIEVLL